MCIRLTNSCDRIQDAMSGLASGHRTGPPLSVGRWSSWGVCIVQDGARTGNLGVDGTAQNTTVQDRHWSASNSRLCGSRSNIFRD